MICNLNFHTSVGGTQRTLTTVLPILDRCYALKVVDPYRNSQFRSLLSAEGIEVETVVDLSDKTYLSVNGGVRKILDFASISTRYLKAALILRHYFLREHVNLIYVNQTKAALFAAIAAPPGIPIIYHCHGVAATGIRVIALLEKRFSRVIANSPFTGRELMRVGFSPRRVKVVTNTIPLNEIRSEAERPPIKPLPFSGCPPVILLAHAGIEPNKGTHLAIEALGWLSDADLPGELWITGDSSYANLDYARYVKALVASLGLVHRVHFLGRRSDIYAVMANADIVLVPSLVKESFGRVAVEAMALGKAVLVSNRGALPNLVQDGTTGKVFDPNAPQALAQALAELVSNPGLRTRYGQAGMESACERFELSEYKRQLLAVFSEVLPPCLGVNTCVCMPFVADRK
jgi:glycosyltransferase involved in cell wall biosynthesis